MKGFWISERYRIGLSAAPLYLHTTYVLVKSSVSLSLLWSLLIALSTLQPAHGQFPTYNSGRYFSSFSFLRGRNKSQEYQTFLLTSSVHQSHPIRRELQAAAWQWLSPLKQTSITHFYDEALPPHHWWKIPGDLWPKCYLSSTFFTTCTVSVFHALHLYENALYTFKHHSDYSVKVIVNFWFVPVNNCILEDKRKQGKGTIGPNSKQRELQGESDSIR